MGYDLRYLIKAYLEARSYARATSDRAVWYSERYRAMALAFGMNPDRFGVSGSVAMDEVAEECVNSLEGLRSPFAGMMEAPEKVIALYRRFGSDIDISIRQAQELVTALLVEVLADQLDIPLDHTVSQDDLRANGLVRSAPADDYFDEF